MKCAICDNKLVQQPAIINIGGIVKRIAFHCTKCQESWLIIDYPYEELVEFRLSLEKGKYIDGDKNAGIFIIMDNPNDTVKMPWIEISSIDNILAFLKNLITNYEVYTTFS